MDGKHVIITKPADPGTVYRNYKKSFSVILIAVADAKHKFLHINIGALGSHGDAGLRQMTPLQAYLSNVTAGLLELEVLVLETHMLGACAGTATRQPALRAMGPARASKPSDRQLRPVVLRELKRNTWTSVCVMHPMCLLHRLRGEHSEPCRQGCFAVAHCCPPAARDERETPAKTIRHLTK